MPAPSLPAAGAAARDSAALVAALARTLGATLLETHISWILLVPGYAYKVKKPVHLPFIDYSTLARRRRFCEEEVRLNRRLAPSLYLGVAEITGSPAAPLLDGPGPVLEVAVRMRRFPDGALFGEQLAAGTLPPRRVDRLAERLAQFHQQAPADRGYPSHPTIGVPQRALAALEGCAPILPRGEREQLQGWLAREGEALLPLWQARRAAGCVREGHGDLHLDNLVALDGEVAAFDGIEFDPALRWIDVIDDVAFTLMDFAARGRPDLGFRFINGWLDRTGEHAALPALRYAVVYRALVRAQVAQLRGDAAAAQPYLRTALAWTRPPQPTLFITHGLPGSGKSFESARLLEQAQAIRLRSDVERKRLHGLAMLDDSRARGVDLYTREAGERTYAHLLATARVALQAGFPTILDAAFLRRGERDAAHALARELGVPFAIVACKAPLPVLRQRLAARRGDASEADLAVLEQLRTVAEPFGEDERPFLHPLSRSGD